LWLQPFIDAQNRRHLLKSSASPTGVPDKFVDPPEETHQPYTGVNLGRFFRLLDQDLQRGPQEELPGAPGIPSAMMDYGEPLTVSAAPGAAPVSGVIQPLRVASPAPPATSASVAPPPTSLVAPAPAAEGPRVSTGMPKAGAAAPTTQAPLMVAKPRRKGSQTIPLPDLTPPAQAPVVAAAPPVGVPPPGKPPMKAPVGEVPF